MTHTSMNGKSGPTFLVIGAQKCGTTWLSEMICQHPEVSATAQKELHYFNKTSNYNKGKEWYFLQFKISPRTKAIGEYTPNYFWTYDDEEAIPDIPKRVCELNPDMKLILLLRNPVNRAVSAYYHHIRKERIMPKEKILVVKHRYGILSMGFYDIHLKNWLKYYSAENFLILIYERDLLDENKINTIKKVFNHIGIDNSFVPDRIFEKVNTQNNYFDIRAQYYFSRFGKLLSLFIPNFIKNHKYWNIPVSQKDKMILNETYVPHNKELSVVLGQNLPW